MLNLKKTLLIYFLLVFTSVNFAWGLKKVRVEARYKACMSNTRVLQGAVEMYNMDHSTQMDDIDEESVKILVKEKYLKAVPEGTEPNCRYTVSNKLSENGIIYCKYHGGVDTEKFPPDPEIKERIEEQKKWSRKMQIQESLGFIIFICFWIFVIIGLFRIIIGILFLFIKPKKKGQQRE